MTIHLRASLRFFSSCLFAISIALSPLTTPAFALSGFSEGSGESARLPSRRVGRLASESSLVSPSIAAVSAGGWHTCALTTGGGVKCWGRNDSGQLGDGTTIERSTPVDVIGLTSGVAAISAGGFHSCALTTGGGVKCWGQKSSVGDGGNIDRTTPVNVSGLTNGVAAIAAGSWHTCVLTTEGGVKCWGLNGQGQLGDGTTTNRATPVTVSGLTSGVTAISAGGLHTCAVLTGGGAKCWGYNGWGALGDGTTTYRPTPVDVSGLTGGVAAISAGDYHTCALTTGNGVKCWGRNIEGQVGDGTTTNQLTSVDVNGLTSGVAEIAAGSYHTCALLAGGGVKCWGKNDYGQLGDGTVVNQSMPVNVSGLTSGVATIDLGDSHTCALLAGSEVKCWGWDGHGQLGTDRILERLTPVDVSGLTSGVTDIAANYLNTCALTSGGGAKCWGNSLYGQLGDGTKTARAVPTDVSGLTSGVAAIAEGSYHTCALTSGGGVKCWGLNDFGQLGDGTTTSQLTPVNVSGLTNGVVAVATGGFHTCALTDVGGVKCWGNNTYGQLGVGPSLGGLTPLDVNGLTGGVAAITGGLYHACALTDVGGVKCWGENNYGQLGDGTTTRQYTPVDVSGLTSGVTAIATGGGHTCALTVSGAVKCWGSNFSGQLGDGTYTDQTTPVNVNGLASGVTAMTAGQYHTCALNTSGGLKCWGYDYYGQLGDGATMINRAIPVNVNGLTSNVMAAAAGHWHTCALIAGGGIKCWGRNTYGQLGEGGFILRTTPTDVVWIVGSPPTLLSPTNNALTMTYTPMLDWGDSTPAPDHYEVQVDDGPDFSAPITTQTIAASAFTPSTSLNPNALYYWRARLFNEAGQYSLWSATRVFRTALAPPETSFPGNFGQPQSLRPLFDWVQVTGATSYTLQIATDPNFTTLVNNLNLSPSAYTMTADLPRGVTLFWRVRGNTQHGPGNWSRQRHFNTANPPSVPILQAPGNGALVMNLTPTLDWADSSPAPTYYEVQIATDLDFVNVLGRGQSGRAAVSQHTPGLPLVAGETYYWRVRATGGASSLGQFSSSQWSSVRWFQTPP
ncbi:MAG: hypothetical protein HYZ49_04700 [Chloroflexi bacterium]|nr:hypothetical protein [Chloroflexota bacterium]